MSLKIDKEKEKQGRVLTSIFQPLYLEWKKEKTSRFKSIQNKSTKYKENLQQISAHCINKNIQ